MTKSKFEAWVANSVRLGLEHRNLKGEPLGTVDEILEAAEKKELVIGASSADVLRQVLEVGSEDAPEAQPAFSDGEPETRAMAITFRGTAINKLIGRERIPAFSVGYGTPEPSCDDSTDED